MCLAFMYIELCCFIWNRTSVRTDCFVAFLYGDIGFHVGTSLVCLMIWIENWKNHPLAMESFLSKNPYEQKLDKGILNESALFRNVLR